MCIALNWKALEAPLPDVSAAAIMLVISPHVTYQQPPHELTQCSLMRGFEHEMEVIRHQAKGEQLNANSLPRCGEQS